MPVVSALKHIIGTGKSTGVDWSSYCTPRTVTVSSVADTSTTLSWDAATGATSYKIYYGTDGTTFGSSTTSTTNSKAVNGLTSGTRYYFYVTALKGIQENLPSNTVDNGVVYVNNFANLTGLTLVETAGTVTVEDPMGTVVLPQKALTFTNTSAGNCYASIDLGQTYNKLYVQFYVSCIKQGGASSYKDTLQIGAAVAGNETAEVKLNQAAGYYVAYGLPNYQVVTGNIRPATIYRVGMLVDRVAQTCDYYLNGILKGQKATNNQNMRYITIGGNNVSGYVLQVSALTVNEDMFMDGVASTYHVGEYTTFFIDSSTDIGIDTSAWSGAQITPYDPDGGTSYIDGPLRYVSDYNNGNYKKYGDTVLFKRGLNYKLKDFTLNSRHGVYLASPTATSYLTMGAYGSGALPKIDSSMVVDSWDVFDADNHVYRKALTTTYLGGTGGVWVDETMGLCLAANLAEVQSNSGRYFKDATHVYIRLWDDGDPADHTIDVASYLGVNSTNYIRVSYLHFRFGGIATSEYGIVEHCEVTLGASISVSKNGIGRYNYIHEQWGGQQYSPARGYSGAQMGISIGENGLAYANKVADCYIGIQFTFASKNALACFNEIKNCIVNHNQVSGGAETVMTQAEAIKFINNTVFHSPRHTNNNPYPIAESQPGHGLVIQSGSTLAKYEIVNNLILVHYNHTSLAGTQSANCLSLLGASAIGIIDFNKVYKSAYCDANVLYYYDTDVYSEHVSDLIGEGWTGYNGDDPEEHSSIETALPVTQADATAISGEWQTTDGTPVETGDGYVFDFSPWGITEDLSGNPLGATRNIGAY